MRIAGFCSFPLSNETTQNRELFIMLPTGISVEIYGVPAVKRLASDMVVLCIVGVASHPCRQT